MTPVDTLASLQALCGLRTAPELSGDQRQRLRGELLERLAACEWFTVGVMAADAEAAVRALRQLEALLGWTPLQLDDSTADTSADGPVAGVFLKGNQTTGRFRVRREAGLGIGVLITGHSAVDPEAEDTWGPFPLDFFA